MPSLKAVLSRYETQVQLGDSEKRVVSEDQLRKDLENVRTANQIRFRILLAVLLIVFLVSLVIIFLFLDNPNQIAVLYGATGLGVAWSVQEMRKLSKEQTTTELLLALLGAMNPSTLKSIINVILSKL